MASYTYGQLEGLWIKAGGNKALAPLMAAIALAESGGNPQATNPTDNHGAQTSWGLWQISDGTHNQPVSNILNPLVNARAAVAKYQTQGLGAWGTYDSGAYKEFYEGDVPASQLPQGGGAPAQAQDASFWSSAFGADAVLNPLTAPLYQIYKDIQGGNTDPLSGLAQSFTIGVKSLTDITHAVEWWFAPSHQVRMFAGLLGVIFLAFGLPDLAKAGSGDGDARLALGILLTVLSGISFFIAFHNLPDDVTSVETLMGWISQSIREGHAASSAAGDTAVTTA